jgi:hypothetical protein
VLNTHNKNRPVLPSAVVQTDNVEKCKSLTLTNKVKYYAHIRGADRGEGGGVLGCDALM